MIRAKLVYAGMLVVLVLFFILYRGNLSFYLLIFGILLPLLLRVLLWIQRAGLTVSLHAPSQPVEKGEHFAWQLRIRNSSYIPGARAEVHAQYENRLTGKPQKIRMEIPVQGSGTEVVEMQFRAVTCGVMLLRVRSIVLFDPLRIWRSSVRVNAEKQVLVLPALQDPPEWEPGPAPEDDNPEYSKDKPGDDPSEIFDFHSYREGDPISRVHWKLSSKLDELMVKEFSLPLPGKIVLIPDYTLPDGSSGSLLRLDAALSLMRSTAEMLIEGEQNCALLCEGALGNMPVPFTTGAELRALLRKMLSVTPEPAEGHLPFCDRLAAKADELRPGDRLLLFLPQIDPKALPEFAELPGPERITVLTVASGAEEEAALDVHSLPFGLIAVPAAKLLPLWEREMYPAETADAKGGAVYDG